MTDRQRRAMEATCKGKKKFTSKADAKAWWKQHRSGKMPGNAKPYNCPVCDYFHLTTLGAEARRDTRQGLNGDKEASNRSVIRALRKQNVSLKGQVGALQSDLDGLSDGLNECAQLFAWLLGKSEEFPERQDGQGLYWWRTELRKRIAVIDDKQRTRKSVP